MAASARAADDSETVNVKVEKLKEKENIQITSIFFICLGIDLATVLLLIVLVYHPNYKKMIGIKDMTYLFIFVELGLLSGIQMDFYELAIICSIIFIITLLIDTKLNLKKEVSKQVKYEKIELVKLEKRDELIAELIERKPTCLRIEWWSIKWII